MVSILAIDAAWTDSEPSGVALISKNDKGIWICQGVSPSYDSFIKLARGSAVNWEKDSFTGNSPNPKSLLDAASILLNGEGIDLVTVDMPVATVPIVGRREADTQISRHFGGLGCATHSPNSERPGKVSEKLKNGFGEMGFPLSTAITTPGTRQRLLEVYPHPAIVRLLNLAYRLPYKVTKSTKYWPQKATDFRIHRLLEQFRLILNGLTNYIKDIPVRLPEVHKCASLAYLKRYEDAIDALVCAWIGICFLEKEIESFGDMTAAIWVPAPPDQSFGLSDNFQSLPEIKVIRRRRGRSTSEDVARTSELAPNRE